MIDIRNNMIDSKPHVKPQALV